MNDDARVSMHDTCMALKSIKQSLNDAANNVENSSIKSRIETQLKIVEDVTKECESIALGVSQHG